MHGGPSCPEPPQTVNMTFTADQISHQRDYRFAPHPNADVHWFRVELGVHRTGWAFVAGSAPIPDVEWVAQELTRQAAARGHALEGALISSGFHLERAPRPEEDTSSIA
jgi:hypothetical protein